MLMLNPRQKITKDEDSIALYHVVYKDDSFELAATMLYQLIISCQAKFPKKKRILYLDIDEHRNNAGGFDNDMMELQNNYILGFLMPYLSKVYLPLGLAVKNPKVQLEDLPEKLVIQEAAATLTDTDKQE